MDGPLTHVFKVRREAFKLNGTYVTDMMRLLVWTMLLTRPFCLAQPVCKVTDPQVLILGAGMSGVAAARTLYDKGITSFVILEAYHKVGGRITWADIGGVKAEQTFNILSGIDFTRSGAYKTNPIWNLMQATNFSYFDKWNSGRSAYDGNGTDVTVDYLAAVDRYGIAWETAANLTAERSAQGKGDISFREALNMSNWFPRTPEELLVDKFYNEYSYGVPFEKISAFAAVIDRTYTDYGNSDVFLTDPRGAQFLVQYLGDPFLKRPNTLHLNTTVSAIEYSSDCVCANVVENGRQGGRYCGRYGIVSFNIGVLQSGIVSFSPPLPQWKMNAIGQFWYPFYMQIFILFNETFWNQSQASSFLVSSKTEMLFRLIGLFYPSKPPLLLVYAVGSLAEKIRGQSLDQTKQDIIDVLRTVYGNFRANVVGISIPDRALYDSYGFFGYNALKIGATHGTFANLSAPVGNLYFSGDASSEIYPNYAHGAYETGLRAANLILNQTVTPNKSSGVSNCFQTSVIILLLTLCWIVANAASLVS